MKILIADDDVSSLLLVKAIVSNAGHEAITTGDGLSAFKILSKPDAPKIAILDWMMPGMNGVEICRRIRKVETREPVFVIMLTCRLEKEDLVCALQAGANDYLVKPCNTVELQTRIGVGCRVVDLQGKLAGQVKELERVGAELVSRVALQEQAEEALLESNAYLENLVNYANVPIIVWDPQFKISRFNHAFEALTGRAAGEVLGKPLDLLFPPTQLQRTMKIIRKTSKGERWDTVEIGILHRDGSVRTVLWNSATLLDPEKKTPIATIAQGHDITTRKQAEEALRERMKELNCLYGIADLIEREDSLEKILQGTVELMPNGWFHPEIVCARITYKGRHYQTGNFRVTDWRQSADFKVAGQPIGLIELNYLEERPIGNEGLFLREERVLLNAIAERLGRVAERKQAEARIKLFSRELIAAREEEKKKVAALLHHDVGSLAVGMSAHLDALEEEARAGKAREALKWAKRGRALFNQSVAHLRNVAIDLRPPELDIVGLCAALRHHFSRVTGQGGVRILFTETLGKKILSGDTPTKMFRITQEAVTNAIRHGHAKKVDVSLSITKNKVLLKVRDNGKGFDPAGAKARDASRMGLRVMQEMTASSGGDFTIKSKRGKGTLVSVLLPLETPE